MNAASKSNGSVGPHELFMGTDSAVYGIEEPSPVFASFWESAFEVTRFESLQSDSKAEGASLLKLYSFSIIAVTTRSSCSLGAFVRLWYQSRVAPYSEGLRRLLYLPDKVTAPLDAHAVVVGAHVLSPRDALEAVEVELPLEGLDPAVAEVLREHVSCEPKGVEYLEG